MALKTLNSLHNFSMKTSSNTTTNNNSSSSSLSSMKLKTLLQTFIFSRMYCIARALTKAKSFLLQLFKDMHFHVHLLEFPLKKNKQKKLFFGSFRLHYNWCSTHDDAITMPARNHHHVYYDSSWNTTTAFDENDELSMYLQGLEDQKGDHHEEFSSNEIDMLADMFIANCHEKFRLEKVESYRRFQEMMARSV